MNKISIYQVIYVADQAGLGMSFSETPKTGFLASSLNFGTYSHW